MERVVFGQRIDHGVGMAPAGFRGDGVVLRQDFKACAVQIACADFAAVLGVGQDKGDFAVTDRRNIE